MVTIEFHEVHHYPHQEEVFSTRVSLPWQNQFGLAFKLAHDQRHPGHNANPSDYRYMAEIPGQGLMFISPQLRPADIGLGSEGNTVKVWIISRDN
ncbi:uncharacterized protein I303_105247 [Kwoniella dejecticola CBS 10117]|uniref:Uncharacterized protein n=1 Tax=Kwoniella dejecticola CBS 10117 TaxID=1296121 RepID=A0A1A6A313_9TREE|nr:uncharacterized protein I303_05306 [Kwoniella dejecticola CBS 10117]OBR84448.1 hypothetical protein I303_05306 [Kwoniella dejecticola CBS 10117]